MGIHECESDFNGHKPVVDNSKILLATIDGKEPMLYVGFVDYDEEMHIALNEMMQYETAEFI